MGARRAAKLRRRRSGVCRSGLGRGRQQAGRWGGVLQQGRRRFKPSARPPPQQALGTRDGSRTVRPSLSSPPPACPRSNAPAQRAGAAVRTAGGSNATHAGLRKPVRPVRQVLPPPLPLPPVCVRDAARRTDLPSSAAIATLLFTLSVSSPAMLMCSPNSVPAMACRGHRGGARRREQS